MVIFDNQCNGVHSTQADSKEARGRVGNEKESVGKRDEMAVLLMTDLLNPTRYSSVSSSSRVVFE